MSSPSTSTVARRAQQRQRQQQPGQKLARDVAADACAGDSGRLPRVDQQRWETLGHLVANRGAERSQRIDQIADRTLAHARDAVEAVVARAEGQRRGQRCASTVPARPRNSSACLFGKGPPRARDHVAVRVIGMPSDAERQRARRASLSCRPIRAVRRARSSPAAKRRQQQHPIRNALRARQTHGSGYMRDRR